LQDGGEGMAACPSELRGAMEVVEDEEDVGRDTRAGEAVAEPEADVKLRADATGAICEVARGGEEEEDALESEQGEEERED